MPYAFPVVMTFAGLDPTGGAGLAADIETIRHLGAHPAPVATALTVQNTQTVQTLWPVTATQLLAQAEAVLADMPVAVFKVGLIGHVDSVQALEQVFLRHQHVPVVLDPVLAAGGGTDFVSTALLEALRARLLPLTTILTPNSVEARRLAPQAATLPECAAQLSDWGCHTVLITGGHEPDATVINTLYQQGHCVRSWAWPRLPNTYHGSGCTLASAIAALLAHDPTLKQGNWEVLLEQAQAYTWQALKAGYPLGAGQWLPQRWGH